jgi:hypothetical protein
MVFNACSSPFGSKSSDSAPDFTPMYFYVDSNGNITEMDSGRTVIVANDKADVVFYSDNISSRIQRVAFAVEEKAIIFFFEENRNFPFSMIISDFEGSYNGFFAPYDPVTQTFSLVLEQNGDMVFIPV